MPPPLPAAIALALDEFRSRDTEQLLRLVKDKGFRRDLADQSSVSPESYVDSGGPLEGDFNIYAAGGLTPFSSSAKCSDIACRLQHAEAFARSTCLYAETVIAPDGFSSRLQQLTASELLIEMAVLGVLEPLIRAGVIRFGPSVAGYCASCKQAITGTFDSVEEELWNQISATFEFKLEDQGGRRRKLLVASAFDRSDGQPITYYLTVTRDDRRTLPLDTWVRGTDALPVVQRHETHLRHNLRGYVSELLFDVSIATPAGAVIGTNYKLGAAALRVLDRRSFYGSSLDDWEELRSVALPWVKGLAAADIVRLREEAAPALPAFRRRLQTELDSVRGTSNEEVQARRLASELRQEALELEVQLRKAKVPAVRRAPTLFAGLGFAVGIYGLGTSNPNMALTGLSMFAANVVAAHASGTTQSHKVTELKRHPAYVLLTARRIHRGH